MLKIFNLANVELRATSMIAKDSISLLPMPSVPLVKLELPPKSYLVQTSVETLSYHHYGRAGKQEAFAT